MSKLRIINNVNKHCLEYVLVTAARNEEKYIDQTIESILKQSIKPLRWVIVSDGSTDGTDDIVKKFVIKNPWIELLRMPFRQERNFIGKILAFKKGYEKLTNISFDIIGNLDADIVIEDEKYFSFFIEKFMQNNKLGIAGSPFIEGTKKYDYRFTSVEHVSGGCQLFRHECFQEIGGYPQIKGGGEDFIACLMARVKGWQTRCFMDKKYIHNRKMGTGLYDGLKVLYTNGYNDYITGGHPIWQILRSIYQMKNKPIILSGFAVLIGYLLPFIKKELKAIPNELIAYHRKEQMQRLKSILKKLMF